MTTAYIIGNRKKIGSEREFKKAEKHLKNFFLEAFNPKEEHATVLMLADYNEQQAQKLFENYMLSCDMVFVLTGWELSSEATAELRLAKKMKMPIGFQRWE